jgi:hypothetical protein
VAALLAAADAIAGGFTLRIGGLVARSHNPLVPAVMALVLAGASLARGLGPATAALAWWWELTERRAAWAGAIAAAFACAAGLAWGTYVAGGSDSYCYLNQAELLARGQVMEVQPLASRAPWPKALAAFIPVGHVPAAAARDAFVPMCAAGYPLILASVQAVGGRAAMFWVVPVFGALAVWLTFVLGRRAAGPAAGVMAAVLLAASPTFLYQVVQPMTDVPAAALWTLALVVATSAGMATGAWPGAFLTGLATGLALLVRPNLAPLAAVIGLWVLATAWRTRHAIDIPLLRTAAAFAAGVLPFVLAVAAVQNAMYGGPLRSGYGDLGVLFTLDHIAPNLARYPVWLIETQTPLIALAILFPWAVRDNDARRAGWLLATFAAATFACYIPYSVFDAWWFLRFVLPAFPPLLVLSSAVIVNAVRRIRPAPRVLVFAGVCGLVALFQLTVAAKRQVFELKDLERRFRDGGAYVARALPQNAAVLTVRQSGSVRFYSGRLAVLWNSLEPENLDRAIEFLRAEGYHPYMLFETDEEPEFRKRFTGHSRLGGLEWPPVADIDRYIRIYDPADYEPYMRGASVKTDRVWTRSHPRRAAHLKD